MSRASRLAKAARRRKFTWALHDVTVTVVRDGLIHWGWSRDDYLVTHFMPGVRLDLAAYHRRRRRNRR